MKRIGITALTAAGLASVLMLSGFDSAMTPQDLLDKAQKAQAEKDFGTIRIGLDADVVVQIGEEASTATNAPMTGQGDMTVSYTVDPFAVSISGNLEGSALGQSGQGTIQEYITENEDGTGSIYVGEEGSTDGGSQTEGSGMNWTAQSIDAGKMKTMKEAVTAARSGDYSTLQAAGLDIEGIRKSLTDVSTITSEPVQAGGKECYEMVTPIGGDTFSSALDQLMNSELMKGKEGSMDQSVLDMAGLMLQNMSMNLVTDYAADDLLPVHGEMDLSGSDFSWIGDMIAQISQAQAAGSDSGSSQIPAVSVNVNTLKGTVDYDFETPVSIVIPEEAKNAPVIPAEEAVLDAGNALKNPEAAASGEGS